MEELTTKQQKVYDFIEDFIINNNYPPTIREIASGVNLSSSATVHAHLKNLEKKNYIKIANNKNRTIELVNTTKSETSSSVVTVPNLGKVTAGNPIEAIEMPDEYVDLPSFLVPSKGEVFTLTVSGDSMINIGVYDGDTAIIEKTSNVKNGDHVVAMTPDFEVTLKTFYKESNHYRLQPENDNLEPIIVKEVQVVGKLIGIYRQY